MIRTLRRLIRETLEQDAPGRKVVTFDFDDTLLWTEVLRDEDGNFEDVVPAGENEDVYPIFIDMLNNPDVEVHIVTSRMGKPDDPTARIPPSYTSVFDNLRRWGVLDKLAGVHFTNGELKVDKLLELGSSVHYDDDPKELEALEGTGIKGEQAFPHGSWMKKSAPNVNSQD